MSDLARKPVSEKFDLSLAPEISQREASDPKSSVWVGASAGSGKTTVLTNRVMRLLLDGVPPQKILCLTFTRAGAAEMANRVTERLSLWATCSDDELRDELDNLQGEAPKPKQLTAARRLFARVLSCPGGMRIRTIHAFCQEILGRFPIEAGLPPHFAVIDEADAETLMDDVQRDLLRELQNAPEHPLSRALQKLVYDLGEHNFAPAMQKILRERARLHATIRQAGSLDNVIEHMRAFLALEPHETEQDIIRNALDFSVLPEKDIRQAAIWLLDGTKTFQLRGKDILRWLALPAEARIAEFESYWRCFLTDREEPFAKSGDKALLGNYPDLERIVSCEAVRLQGVLERLETAGVAEATEAILRFGLALAEGFEKRKSAQAALDYDDLIIRTDRLLHHAGIAPWVLYKLDGGLDHILVDEAQDTSRAQWSIVKALADEFFGGISARGDTKRTLFVVGDEKQSIFSFQNADPEAFAEMRDYFAQRLDETGETLHSVGLHISFRSAPKILEAIDSVFAPDNARAGVASEPIHHFAARPRKDEEEKIGRVEVWPLIPVREKEAAGDGAWVLPLDYEDEHDPQAELAATIAAKIGHWLKNTEILPGTERIIQPGDIMILLRNRGRFADLMVRALKKYNVPVTGVDRMNLTQQLPVMDLLALMQFTLLPEDDLNLAAVLRGPLLNCSEEQLMELAIGRDGSLWQSLRAKAQNNPAFTVIADYLASWLREADFITPFTLLARILNTPCPGSDISGRRALWSRLGPDALDPLEELLNAAQNFGARHTPSLQGFLHWIMANEKIIKRELDRGGGQVRIMTVHGSKGLEAPIVFLPDTTSIPRVQDVPKFLWSANGVPLYLSRKPKTGAAAQLWQEARRKQMEEYRRLLYVALTRAANRLYIGGWEQSRKDANAEECWYKLIEDTLKPLHEPSAVSTEDMPQPEIALADPVLRKAKTAKPAQEIAVAKMELPAWVRQPVENEPDLLDIFSPSQMEAPATATPDSAFARGRIIHRLLQSLPDMAEAGREKTAAHFLANPRHNLTADQQQEIQTEVLQLLRHPEYASLFGPNSRAEIPLTGQMDGRMIAGQVDRLCLRENEVWIVDYKTSRPPPVNAAEVPMAYRRQLAAYRVALQDIYPGKAIRCFLLWTYRPCLMEIPEDILVH